MRLQSNSPCINAGLHAYVPGAADLDRLPHIVSGTVDIGAHEFQAPHSLISYAWLQKYGLPTDGSADFADPDSDGLTTWQGWRCQTDPTNALSVLRLLSVLRDGTTVRVSWQSVAGVTYFHGGPPEGRGKAFHLLGWGLAGRRLKPAVQPRCGAPSPRRRRPRRPTRSNW